MFSENHQNYGFADNKIGTLFRARTLEADQGGKRPLYDPCFPLNYLLEKAFDLSIFNSDVFSGWFFRKARHGHDITGKSNDKSCTDSWQ